MARLEKYEHLPTAPDIADRSRHAALVVVASDILEFGAEYARTCIANAWTLVAALVDKIMQLHRLSV